MLIVSYQDCQRMRMGVSGPSGAGKTTFCKALSAKWHLPLAHEGAREAANVIGVESSRALDRSNARAFQEAVLKEKVLAEDGCGDRFVSDRTVVDCAAFWLWRQARGVLQEDGVQQRSYFGRIEKLLVARRYDTIVLLSAENIPWVNDNFREREDVVFYVLMLGLLHGTFSAALTAAGTRILECPTEFRTTSSRLTWIETQVGST